MIKRFLKFGIVGLSGAVIFFGILIILVEFFHLDKRLAWFISAMASILNNFIWNNLYTWPERSAKTKKQLGIKMLLYYLFTFASAGINYLIYISLLRQGIYYLLSAAFAVFVASFLSFFSYHFVVWREKPKSI